MSDIQILAEKFDALLEHNRQLVAQNADVLQQVKKLAQSINHERKQWYSAEETLKELGVPVSNNAKRRLKWARERGHLTVFGSRSPYTYLSEEVKELAKKVKANKVYLPPI